MSCAARGRAVSLGNSTNQRCHKAHRVLTALRAFLQTLADNAALCSLARNGDRLRFRDAEPVRRGLEALNQLTAT